jgi:hypothetical protein
MKRSKLIQIIKEEVKREIMIEGIIDSLIALFLSPKIKKDVKKLKGSPEWIELVHKLNATREEMEIYNKRFEDSLDRLKKSEAAAKKAGIKLSKFIY